MASAKAKKAKLERTHRAQKLLAQARIVEDLTLEEVQNLPALSATLLEFAQPLTSTMPVPPRRKDVEAGMRLAQIAWNLPLLRQHQVDSELGAQWDAVAPTLPPPVFAILEAMMTARRTTYGRDPRLATIEIRFTRSGEYSIHAQARLVTQGMASA